MTQSVFEHLRAQVWPYRYAVTLEVRELHGGRSADPEVVELWLKKQSGYEEDSDQLRRIVAEALAELGESMENATWDDAFQKVIDEKRVTVFHRLPGGELAIRGSNVKAMLKEAFNSLWGGSYWTKRNKGLLGWFPENVFVEELWVPLGVTEPDGIDTFPARVSTAQGPKSVLKSMEHMAKAEVSFTLACSTDLDRVPVTQGKSEIPIPNEERWGHVLLYAGDNTGLGAGRGAGFGTFTVTRFDRID